MTQNQIQEQILQKALKFYEIEKFGYLHVAMRVGKTLLTINILKNSNFPIILIAYPDNKLKEVWEKEMVKWNFSHPLVYYTNFSSLGKWTELRPDFFIIDEFHATSEKERDLCYQIMTGREGGIKTLGLSGTVSKYTKELWGLKEIAKYTTLEGINAGFLADYEIQVHTVKLDTVVKTPNKKNKLLSEKQRYDNYTYVINKFKQDGKDTMHLILSRNRLSISSIGKLNYLKNLLSHLKDKRVIVFAGLTEVADSIGIPSQHSKSKNDDNFQSFQRGDINHLALCESGKVGVSYTNLEYVILLNFLGSPENTSQAINRAIQLDYLGKQAKIIILCLDEYAEKEKLKNSLSMLDKNRIKYV